MKWTKQPPPNHGDTKTIRKFAWFPTRMSDEVTTVWLESYEAKLMYRVGWRAGGWCTIKRNPIPPGFPEFSVPPPPAPGERPIPPPTYMLREGEKPPTNPLTEGRVKTNVKQYQGPLQTAPPPAPKPKGLQLKTSKDMLDDLGW